MSRPASDLQERHRYQRTVLTLLMARELAQSCLSRPTQILRVEAPEPEGVDDIITETKDCRHCWQVKTNAKDLPLKAVQHLIDASLQGETCHLALRNHVRVAKVGSTSALQHLCRQAQRQQSVFADIEAQATQGETAWIRAIRTRVPDAVPDRSATPGGPDLGTLFQRCAA